MEVRHHCLFESCMNFLKTFICPALLTVFSPDRHVLKATDFDHLYAPMKLHMKQECTFKKNTERLFSPGYFIARYVAF